MSEHHSTSFRGDILAAIREAIEGKLPGAVVEASGGGGHFQLAVTSQAFAGKTRIEQQRLVYSAIAHLMAGADAPVHAVDSLLTRLP
jgi:acid stress-induced BolA-like protein IbaG/YrbA